MVRKISRTKVTAIVLFLIGIALPIWYRHWLATRTFFPLDMPVSLSRGHFQTGEFYINLPEQYFVRLNIDEALVDWKACGTCGFESLLATRLALFHNGNPSIKIRSEQYTGGNYDSIGYFDADESGLYSLQVEILSDGSCLNKAHPRLSVAAFSDPDHEFHYQELWLSAILLVSALGLWKASALALTAKRILRGERLVIFEDARTRHHGRRMRRRRPQPFAHLRLFGIVYAFTVSIVLLIVLLLISISPRSKGIRILNPQ